MSAVISDQTYSPEAYLALERAAAFKSELHDGHIYAMTGASREHNLVSVNICRELSLRLKDRPCEVYINDIRVRAAENSRVTGRSRPCGNTSWSARTRRASSAMCAKGTIG